MLVNVPLKRFWAKWSRTEKNVDIVGIDPTTSRMRTTRSTTEPNARTDTPHAKSTNKYASYKRL